MHLADWQNLNYNKSQKGYGATGSLNHSWWESNWYKYFGKAFGNIIKLKTSILNGPAIAFLDISLKGRYNNTPNNQLLETTHLAYHHRMCK